MASVNPLSRELVFKLVYYGPGLGGKTTTLEHIHATAKPEHRGKLVSLATPVDRTLYFDFLPVRLPPIRGMHIRLQLFTVPGQVYFNATRKLVLTGADGIVFVADSQIVRADANLESLENLRENLAEQGRDLATMPIVFQHNKRDLPDLLPVEELDSMLNPFGAPSLPTSAKTGEGIYESLEKIAERVLDSFKDKLPEELADGDLSTSFEPVEGGLVTALRDVTQRAEPPADVVVARIDFAGAHPSIPPETPEPEASDITVEVPEAPALPESEPVPLVAPAPLAPSMEAVLPAQTPFALEPEVSASGPPPRASTFPEAPRESPLPPRAEPAPPSVAAPALVRSPERPLGVSFAELWPEGEQEMVREVGGIL